MLELFSHHQAERKAVVLYQLAYLRRRNKISMYVCNIDSSSSLGESPSCFVMALSLLSSAGAKPISRRQGPVKCLAITRPH